jgi:hypothetical protein
VGGRADFEGYYYPSLSDCTRPRAVMEVGEGPDDLYLPCEFQRNRHMGLR